MYGTTSFHAKSEYLTTPVYLIGVGYHVELRVCYNILPALSFLTKLSYIIFFGVHINYAKYDIY